MIGDSIGIEAIGFSTSNIEFSLKDFADAKGQDHEKFENGLWQKKMSVISPVDDVITLAYNAVMEFSNEELKKEIDLVLFATESEIDCSKSLACELHNLLNLKKQCRCLDVKHACYGGTGAVYLAQSYVKSNKQSKVLVVMSDVAWYGFDTAGENTNGCGAVALLISNDAKIATFNNDNIHFTDYKNDFYRPVWKSTPICEGHYSIKCYLTMFKEVIKAYSDTYFENENTKFSDNFDYLISHMPFPKMLDKCMQIAGFGDKINNYTEIIKQYPSLVGNMYTGSLYAGLLSLLENCKDDLSGKKIVMFSYGSGAQCEMYSLNISNGYNNFLNQEKHHRLLNERKKIDYKEYKRLFSEYEKREVALDYKPIESDFNYSKNGNLVLTEIKNGIRYYKEINF